MKNIFIIVCLLFSFNLTSQNLSVKNRWNIKAGYALYKTHNYDVPSIEIGGIYGGLRYLPKSNVRIELNYGVLKWLEVGGYFGLMSYKYMPAEAIYRAMAQGVVGNLNDSKKAILPTFGVNANVHLLPFFVKNEKCHWDFYIPVRYGGFYLTKWMGDYCILYNDMGTWDSVGKTPKDKKYRHEYGAGLGGAYYIKNIIGFYIEALGGQFSYEPNIFLSPYAIRVGLTAKF